MDTEFINSIGMKFRLIPAGDFRMGYDLWKDSHPEHLVRITKPFYIGIYPVTQEQWLKIMPDNPSMFKGDLQRPVEEVNYKMIESFLKVLNKNERKNHRLPTEAEWEYACRAGSNSIYYFGNDPMSLSQYAWYYDNSGGTTQPVGQKKPNSFGLYDMLGNVCELCSDSFFPYPKEKIRTDPISEGDILKVMRGGCYNYPGGKNIKETSVKLVTSFWRRGVKNNQKDEGHGFRIAFDA